MGIGTAATLAAAALALPAAPLPRAATGSPTPTRSAPPVQASGPNYMVVEGLHPGATGFQSLTVLCPGGLKAVSAGFSAVVLADPTKPGARQIEEGVGDVRSFPDLGGTGWRVEGYPGDLTRQPWRLAERVVCLRVN